MAAIDYRRNAPAAGMTAGAPLWSALGRLAARRNLMKMWRCLVHCLIVGVGAAAAMVLAYRLYLVDGEWWMPLLPVALAAIIGWRAGSMEQAGPLTAAMDADQALGLQDRLSSALAFVHPEAVRRARRPSRGGSWPDRVRAMLGPRLVFDPALPAGRTELVPALVRDADDRTAELEPRHLYPLRLDRPVLILAGLCVLLATFVLMPNLDWLRSVQQRRQSEGIVNQGQQLAALAKELQGRKELEADQEAKRLTHRLAGLAHRMQRGHMTKRAALVELGQLHKELQKAASHDSQSSSGSVEEALRDLQNESMQSPEGQKLQHEMQKGDTAKAAEQLDKLADKMEKQQQMSDEERRQAAHDLKKAADALRRQGGQQNQDAANKLEQAAKSLQQPKQQAGRQGQQGQPQGQSQQGKGGQKGGSSGNSAGAGAQALRKMAQGLRQGAGQSGNQQSMRDMLKKIQEAEKNTGSNSGNQEGPGKQPGKGGNGQPGEGKEGEGLTPGKDIMPTDPTKTGGGGGLGPRNHVRQHGSGGGVSDSRTKHTGDKRRWADQWSDRLPQTHKKIDRVTGKYGNEGEVDQLPTRSESSGGHVTTPDYQVPPSYRKDEEDAINKETVPPAYKESVRNYFDTFKNK